MKNLKALLHIVQELEIHMFERHVNKGGTLFNRLKADQYKGCELQRLHPPPLCLPDIIT